MKVQYNPDKFLLDGDEESTHDDSESNQDDDDDESSEEDDDEEEDDLPRKSSPRSGSPTPRNSPKVSRNHSTNSTLRGPPTLSAHSTLTRHQAAAMASQLARNPPVPSEHRPVPDFARFPPSDHRSSLLSPGHPAAQPLPVDHKRTPSDLSRTPSDIGHASSDHSRSLVEHKRTPSERSTQSPHYRDQISAQYHEPRLVYPIMKKSGDLGVRLVGGNAVGIFVHSVDMDSPAFNVGLRCADQE